MSRTYYELRILGWRAVAPPLLILGGAALFALAIATLTAHGTSATLATFLTASSEMVLPLAAGIICAMRLTQDAALELQLTLPTPFARTALRRWGLLIGWGACCAWAGTSLMVALGLWHIPRQIQTWTVLARDLAAHLIWLAPLVWLGAVGLTLALLLRHPIASAALMGGIWISETFAASFFTTVWLHPFFLFPTTFTPAIDFWLANRLALLGTGLLLLPLCYWRLCDSEALFRAAGQAE